MFLSHCAFFLITSCSQNFEDYVQSILYMVLSLPHNIFVIISKTIVFMKNVREHYLFVIKFFTKTVL